MQQTHEPDNVGLDFFFMTTELHAIALKSQTNPRHRFQNLYGLIDSKLLYRSWKTLNKQSSPGVDGVNAKDYQQRLKENVLNLHAKLKEKRYRTMDVKRVHIPKANGKIRALGLPTLEDKLVQQSVSFILQGLWEGEFLRFSYGYRPNKSAHQAVESLNHNLRYKNYGYIVEADIKGFFDNMSHQWLCRMLEQKIDDKAIMSLIKQWLKSRVVTPDGRIEKPAKGTPQGGVISPVLANIYLHYVIDLWFEKKIKPRCEGKAMLVRYADDFVVAFQYWSDAQAFYKALPERLQQFELTLSASKTHLKRISRFQPGRKYHFKFLGFVFYWERRARGELRLRRKTDSKKLSSAMTEFYRWIKFNRSRPIRALLLELRRKLVGFQNYFGLRDNSRSLNLLYNQVLRYLHKWLNRRSQRKSLTWQGLIDLLNHFHIKPLRVKAGRVAIDWY